MSHSKLQPSTVKQLNLKWRTRRDILCEAGTNEKERIWTMEEASAALTSLFESHTGIPTVTTNSLIAMEEQQRRLADTLKRNSDLKYECEHLNQRLLQVSSDLKFWTAAANAAKHSGNANEVASKLHRAVLVSEARVRELKSHTEAHQQAVGLDDPIGDESEEAVGRLQQTLAEILAKMQAAEAEHKERQRLREQSTSAVGKGQGVKDVLEEVKMLRMQINELRRQELHLMRQEWMQLVSQPNAGLRGMSPAERMSEAMAYLKSTVINFASDLKKIRQVINAHDYEKEFKAAHNELKVIVSMMLSKEENRAFQQHKYDVWPINQDLLKTRFPKHKIDVCYGALQEMVIAWDSMATDARRRLTTAHDVVANAEVLYFMAKHVATLYVEKRLSMYQRVQRKTPTESPRASPKRSSTPRHQTPPTHPR